MKKVIINTLLSLAIFVVVTLLGLFLMSSSWWASINPGGVDGQVTALNVTISILIIVALMVAGWFCGKHKQIWFVIGLLGGYLLSYILLIALMPQFMLIGLYPFFGFLNLTYPIEQALLSVSYYMGSFPIQISFLPFVLALITYFIAREMRRNKNV